MEGTIYRPPNEAYTYLLQVTAGCTHNACRFCTMYRDKAFHLIEEEIIRENLEEQKRICEIYGRPLRRIFLVDGDVFSLSAGKLEEKIALIRSYLPELQVISMYAAVRSIRNKSDEELRRLHSLGVDELYIGYETGLDDVLTFMNKGTSLQDSLEQAERLHAAGIRHHALLLLGAAGKGRGEESGRAAAELINRIRPEIARFTTLSIFPGSELEEDVRGGRFTEAGELEILIEEKTCLENICLPEVVFQANHVLNSAPVQGTVGRDRQWMLEKLTRAMDEFDEERFRKNFRRTHL